MRTEKKKYTQNHIIEMVKLTRNGTGEDRYERSVQDQESVRLLVRLRTGSAGLLEDKKSRRMV